MAKITKLSIITITYKDFEGLRNTYDNLRNQSFRDFEWIVIDGESGTDVLDFLHQHANDISYWCSEPDGGIYNAMNKGLSVAKGERVLFLNSGDCLLDNGILDKVFSQSYNEDVVYGDCIYAFSDKERLETYPDHLTVGYMYVHSICHQASFIRRSLFDTKGYDESLRIVADWKRNVEFLLEGRTFRHLPYPITRYDATGISSTNIELCSAERQRVIGELLPKYVIEMCEEYAGFNERVFGQALHFYHKNKLYKRIIRSAVHLIRLIEGKSKK